MAREMTSKEYERKMIRDALIFGAIFLILFGLLVLWGFKILLELE